jgi:hypothetical protein
MNERLSLTINVRFVMAAIRNRANAMTPQKNETASGVGEKPILSIRRSVQEIRRIAIRLAQRRIEPEHIVAWSASRRTRQAVARQAHLKIKMQL